MDISPSAILIGEDNVGIPDDLRCKRSDGKQWRCTAMSMPDKTVCEKHYIQAKKRAANSALRASLKKAKRKSVGESSVYLESKSDDKDMPLMDIEVQDYPTSSSGKKFKDRLTKNKYSPDSSPPRMMSIRNPLDPDDDIPDGVPFDENQRSYRSSPVYGAESSRNMGHNINDNGTTASSEDQSDASTDSSDDTGGLTCHQCRRSDKNSVVQCLKCNRRGYCSSCINTWYKNIPVEEIQRVCPACRGSCSCKVCSKGDNLIKARIREIPVLDKLRYLYCLMSSVLPIVKQIHQQQCAELELEKKLHGAEVDLERKKLNADEQMCCDCCRVPIIDYHLHCSNCSYDLCLSCCRDLRNASDSLEGSVVKSHMSEEDQLGNIPIEQEGSSKHKIPFSVKIPGWRANRDGSVPCPPREHGGCGCAYLTLRRIFKMYWVSKLVKNLEEMVSGCKVNDTCASLEIGIVSRLFECAYRKDGDENFLYCPSVQDTKSDGIDCFRQHWVKGEPILVKQVCDISSSSSWDPMVIWNEICEITDEMKDASRMVKAVDCLDWSEVDIELGMFMKGYSEGHIQENGWPQMLKLKDWPSPSASEEFLSCQRPEFINKVPFLEFIHSKWGLLNVAAKLPHYSLQNDVGPRIFISYGFREELERGDSVTNLHLNVRDMVYLLVHSCEVALKDRKQSNNGEVEKAYGEHEGQGLSEDGCKEFNDKNPYEFPFDECDGRDVYREAKLDINLDEPIEEADFQTIDLEREITEREVESSDACAGATWDVFRRQDIPKLAEYLRSRLNEFGNSDSVLNDHVNHPLFDEALYLNRDQKKKLKEEYGVEPWSFDQYLGQAVFIPAGCPFQVKNLQSTVQLGLDFLSPESLEQAIKLSEEIRCLPNDHAAKLQMVEVGKISLYAASSAIKEVQKLVLDQKVGAELGFEDCNLTAMVSENLERMIKRRDMACA